jgi:hypothetical protein
VAQQAKASGREAWARLGAATRLEQLMAEMTAIYKVYPELRRGTATPSVSSVRPKRQMSAAARKAMSDGMRKYWAKRKASEK